MYSARQNLKEYKNYNIYGTYIAYYKRKRTSIPTIKLRPLVLEHRWPEQVFKEHAAQEHKVSETL